MKISRERIEAALEQQATHFYFCEFPPAERKKARRDLRRDFPELNLHPGDTITFEAPGVETMVVHF